MTIETLAVVVLVLAVWCFVLTGVILSLLDRMNVREKNWRQDIKQLGRLQLAVDHYKRSLPTPPMTEEHYVCPICTTRMPPSKHSWSSYNHTTYSYECLCGYGFSRTVEQKEEKKDA